jgi:hypothetical protein
VQPIAKLGAKFPQASALEAMLMREEAEKAKAVEVAKSAATQNAPTKPPPAAARAPITDRPSEQTRIFAPNLHDPQLRPSHGPQADAIVEPEKTVIPREPKLPSGMGTAVPTPAPVVVAPSEDVGLLAESSEEDQTRTYSAETIDRLLSGKEATKSTAPEAMTPTVSVAADEDVTRIYSSPPAGLVGAEGAAPKRNINDDITRTFESPVDSLMQEREATSPGRRVNVEPLVIIAPEPQSRSRKRYWALGLLAVAAVAGWTFRAPIVTHSRALAALVMRGVDSTRSGHTAASPAGVTNQISLSISVSPADAKLTLDGVSVPNPLVMQRQIDKVAHELVAEAPGYQSLKRTIHFERDLTVMLGLAALPAAPSPEATKTEALDDAPAAAADTKSSTTATRSVARTRRVVRHESSGDAAAPAGDASGAKAAACNPPYNIDEQGVKTFKPECL